MYNPIFLTDNRISLKLVQKLTNCYKSYFKNYYFDRFGFLDLGCKTFELPSPDQTSFLDACLERADELSHIPNLRIAFSAGIDTTFLLALFKAMGKNVKLLHYKIPHINKENYLHNYVSKAVMNYAREHYDLKIITDRNESIFDGSTYTGCLADALFFPTQAVKGGWKYSGNTNKFGYAEWLIKEPADIPNYTLDKWCKMPNNGRLSPSLNQIIYDTGKGIPRTINFTEEEIVKVKEYFKLFNASTNDNWSIVRLINFCFSYYAFFNEHPFSNKKGTKSFFDTQKFTDIAWTQYRDANRVYPPDKSIEIKFIKKVFGTDFGVHKNW